MGAMTCFLGVSGASILITLRIFSESPDRPGVYARTVPLNVVYEHYYHTRGYITVRHWSNMRLALFVALNEYVRPMYPLYPRAVLLRSSEYSALRSSV